MKKKTGFKSNHAKRQVNEKPIPEKVLSMLEKRKKKLEKKIKLMEEETPINKRAFKKRLESKQLGLESLKKQIKDNRSVLAKELKKRQQTEDKPQVINTLEQEAKEMEKQNFINDLRRAALEASRKRREEEENKLAEKREEYLYREECMEAV